MFNGILNSEDHFDAAIASIGDLNNSHTVDLAIGAPLDDNGGLDKGAVWILFLDEPDTRTECERDALLRFLRIGKCSNQHPASHPSLRAKKSRLLTCFYRYMLRARYTLASYTSWRDKMKKCMTGIILLGISSTAFAEAPGGPNCGWGNMLFDGTSGLGNHMLASTTNGTSGNATFGMTSGTNGCSTNGTLTYGGREIVMSPIMDEFSEDVARGHGDAMDAVDVMIGIEPQDRPAFAQTMHENFAVIFPSEEVTAGEAMTAMHGIMQNDELLVKYTV